MDSMNQPMQSRSHQGTIKSKPISNTIDPLFTINVAIVLLLGVTLCFLLFYSLGAEGIAVDTLGTSINKKEITNRESTSTETSVLFSHNRDVIEITGENDLLEQKAKGFEKQLLCGTPKE